MAQARSLTTRAKPFQKRSVWGVLKKDRTLILMCLPVIVFFIVFSYIPMGGIYIAFINFNYAAGIFKSPFVGLNNFQFLIKSGDLVYITVNTVLYNLAFIVLGNLLQITIAIMLNEIRSRRFRKVTQTIMFLPYFISTVIVGLLIYNIFNYDYGFFNVMRQSIGLEPMAVYSMPNAWPFIIVITNMWQGAGYGSIVYFAAITGLDAEVMEAAAIDGANAWQRIWNILIPLLRPTFVILFLFSIGSILKGNFGLFYNLVGSNNTKLFPKTDIIETYVFRSLMNNFNFSMSSAVSLYQSIFGFFTVILANWAVRKIEPEYSLF